MGWSDGDGEHFDVVIASDDLYDDGAFPSLLASLQAIAGPKTLVLFSYKRRMNEREVPFFERIEEIFEIGVVDVEDAGCEPYTETYVVMAGKKGGDVGEMIKGRGETGKQIIER
jgi:hypothetical protein